MGGIEMDPGFEIERRRLIRRKLIEISFPLLLTVPFWAYVLIPKMQEIFPGYLGMFILIAVLGYGIAIFPDPRMGQIYAKFLVKKYKNSGDTTQINKYIYDCKHLPGGALIFRNLTLDTWMPLAKEFFESRIDPPMQLEELFTKMDNNHLNIWWRPMRLERQRRKVASQ